MMRFSSTGAAISISQCPSVRRARIHLDVKIIPWRAFHNRQSLIYVEFHDDIEIVGRKHLLAAST